MAAGKCLCHKDTLPSKRMQHKIMKDGSVHEWAVLCTAHLLLGLVRSLPCTLRNLVLAVQRVHVCIAGRVGGRVIPGYDSRMVHGQALPW